MNNTRYAIAKYKHTAKAKRLNSAYVRDNDDKSICLCMKKHSTKRREEEVHVRLKKDKERKANFSLETVEKER